MEKLAERLALYDIFARMVTGIIVLFAAEYFGVFAILGIAVQPSEFNAGKLLVTGYFCGIVLETAALPLKGRRRKYEETFFRSKGYDAAQFSEMKRKLRNDGKQFAMDEAMAHIVMSLSVMIASVFFLAVKTVNLFCPMGQFMNRLGTDWKDILVLVCSAYLFGYRAKYYTGRRVEQICSYSPSGSDSLEKQSDVSAGTDQ